MGLSVLTATCVKLRCYEPPEDERENEVVANNYEHDNELVLISSHLVMSFTAIIPVLHPYTRGFAVAPASQTYSRLSVDEFHTPGYPRTPCKLTFIKVDLEIVPVPA